MGRSPANVLETGRSVARSTVIVCDQDIWKSSMYVSVGASLVRLLRSRPGLSRGAGVALFMSVAVAIGTFRQSQPMEQSAVAAANRNEPQLAKVLDSNTWLNDVRSGRIFRNGQGVSSPKPQTDRASQNSVPAIIDSAFSWPWTEVGYQGRRYSQVSLPYRTMCVRTCDGYYFPISTSTTSSRFKKDVRTCASMCDAPTRLFYYPINGHPSHMKDLTGRPYTDLPTAFLYRSAYNSDCKCRPHPWEAAAKQRHAVYALEAQRKKSRDREEKQRLAQEIKELKGTVKASDRASEQELKIVTERVLETASQSAKDDRVDQHYVAGPLPWTVEAADPPASVGSAPELCSRAGTRQRPPRYQPPMALGAAEPRTSAKPRDQRRSFQSNNYSQSSWRTKAFSAD